MQKSGIIENLLDNLKNRPEPYALAKNLWGQGLVLEACKGTQRQVMFVKGRVVDLKLYSVLPDEWGKGDPQ